VTALLAIEVRRLLSRRFLHLIVLAAIVGGAVAGLILYLRSNAVYSIDAMKGTLEGTTVPFVDASWLLAASFVGAEWRAGTMTTLLTWEPRRERVILAKALAVAAIAAALTFVLQCAIAGMLLPGAYRHGAARIDSAWLHSVGGLVGRGAALAAMAAVIGLAVGMIGRNTAFSVGAIFVYLAILETGLLGNFFPGMRRWLLVGNSTIFVSGQTSIDVVGRSVIGAGLILALYSVGCFLVATAVFRARDVT
jgi:ABC-type transport system involved in multi-copper enzyme maturation permease subunit